MKKGIMIEPEFVMGLAEEFSYEEGEAK